MHPQGVHLQTWHPDFEHVVLEHVVIIKLVRSFQQACESLYLSECFLRISTTSWVTFGLPFPAHSAWCSPAVPPMQPGTAQGEYLQAAGTVWGGTGVPELLAVKVACFLVICFITSECSQTARVVPC